MNVIKKVVVFAVVLCTVSLHAMKRQRTEMVEKSDQNKKQALEEKPYFDTFSHIIQQRILPLTTIVKAQQKYFPMIRVLNCLSLTSKALNATLNDQKLMFDCIEQISDSCDCSHQRTSRKLRIKMANEIHDWQELLHASIHEALSTHIFPKRSLNRLVKMGVNINFTYYDNQETLLATALMSRHRNNTRTQVIDWLMKNKARTASITKGNACAASLALYAHDTALVERFFNHPQLNPHHTDSDGNTLLHHCIAVLQRRKHQGTAAQKHTYCVRQLIERLLQLNINTSIENTKGTTALMMAKRLRDIPLIKLLKQYIPPHIEDN